MKRAVRIDQAAAVLGKDAMVRIIRDWRWSLAAVIALLALIAIPIGCSQLRPQSPPAAISAIGPIVRVLIVERKPEIQLAANVPPTVRIGERHSSKTEPLRQHRHDPSPLVYRLDDWQCIRRQG